MLNINNLLIKWKDYFHYFCYVSFLFNERPLADRFGITLCSYYSTDPIGRNINTRLSLVQLTRSNNIITQFSLVVDLYSCWWYIWWPRKVHFCYFSYEIALIWPFLLENIDHEYIILQITYSELHESYFITKFIQFL